MGEERGFFESIFDVFEAAAREGESWGSPWGIVFPVALGLFVALWIFGGLRYAAEKVQDEARPWVGIMFLIIAVLIIAALARDRIPGDDDPAGGSTSGDTFIEE